MCNMKSLVEKIADPSVENSLQNNAQKLLVVKVFLKNYGSQ